MSENLKKEEKNLKQPLGQALKSYLLKITQILLSKKKV